MRVFSQFFGGEDPFASFFGPGQGGPGGQTFSFGPGMQQMNGWLALALSPDF